MELIWDGFEGYDLHVLRNGQASLPLEQFLRVGVAYIVSLPEQDRDKYLFWNAADLRQDHTLVDIFRGVFFFPSWETDHTKPPAVNTSTRNGVTVDMSTGTITAAAAPAGDPGNITSFGITIVLFSPAPTSPPASPVQPPAGADQPLVIAAQLPVMVHVHGNILAAWMTPSTLTVRSGLIKGIEDIGLKVLGTDTIKKIDLYTDPAYTKLMNDDLLLNLDPFQRAAIPAGTVVMFQTDMLLTNRLYFRYNEVFYDPIHVLVSYASSGNTAKCTIPLHNWWNLNQPDTILKDDDGNDVFSVDHVIERYQYRASVYAAFDDGTTGDISNWHELQWVIGDGVDANDIKFDNFGAFKAFDSAIGKTLTIKAKLPPRLSTAALTEVTGNIKVIKAWGSDDLIAKPVPNSPVHTMADDVVNILFVAEGFTDENKFGNMVRDLCGQLRDNTKTAPWNYLFTSKINTWMLFQASEERAASVLSECVAMPHVSLLNKDTEDIALSMLDLIIAGPKLSDQVTFYDFIVRVGLPVPADKSASMSGKLTQWKALFGTDIGSGNWAVTQDIFDFWQKLGQTRCLAEERNTAFGLRCGSKPTLTPHNASRSLAFNENARLGHQHINQLLTLLKANDANGDLIGEKLWGRDKDGKFAKDFGLIIFLADGLLECGARLGIRYYPDGLLNQGVFAGMGDDNFASLDFFAKDLPRLSFFNWKTAANPHATELVPFDNSQLSISVYATVAHELAHFFNLRDEYAVPGNKQPAIPPDLKKVYNLQLASELQDNSLLSGDKIKWRWPRLKKAAVLAIDPVVDSPATGQLTVTLKQGQGRLFAQNDEVRLRQKNILDFTPDKLLSPKCNISAIAADVITLVPTTPGAFQWADFKQGSLLVQPTAVSSTAEDNPMNDDYAELLSSMARHTINQTHKSFTKEPCEEDTVAVQQPVNTPSMLSDPSDHSKLVGLFAGGDEYSCGIYHPTGQCIMRSHQTLTETVNKRIFDNQLEYKFTPTIYPFCPVCRYSLVDQIDPAQHDKIDRLYDSDYARTSFYSRNWGKIWIVIGIVVVGVAVGIYLYKKNDSNQS